MHKEPVSLPHPQMPGRQRLAAVVRHQAVERVARGGLLPGFAALSLRRRALEHLCRLLHLHAHVATVPPPPGDQMASFAPVDDDQNAACTLRLSCSNIGLNSASNEPLTHATLLKASFEVLRRYPFEVGQPLLGST